MSRDIEDYLIPEGTKLNTSKIKVIGVGGGGCNAVNRMYEEGIKDVEFMICNTDIQSLSQSSISDKIQLGSVLTRGLGAGCDPDKGRNAAIESIEDIKRCIGKNIEMVFITAGMGGGTGTGAAPVIAKVAKEMGLLTIAVVTTPFSDEGYETLQRAYNGLEELKKYVDSLLMIDNQKIYEIYEDLLLIDAFKMADKVLNTAVKGIVEIITVKGIINVDMADVKMVMNDSGMAIMGMGTAKGEDRAIKAVEEAFNSPLRNDIDLRTAKNALVNISFNENGGIKASELQTILEQIKIYTGQNFRRFKRGVVVNNSVEPGAISVTIVATGFKVQFAPPIPERDSINDENMLTISEEDEDPNKIILTTLISNDHIDTGNLRHIDTRDIGIYDSQTNLADFENETALSRRERLKETRLKEERLKEQTNG